MSGGGANIIGGRLPVGGGGKCPGGGPSDRNPFISVVVFHQIHCKL